MGKNYNIQLKSTDATTITNAYSNVTYNIDWANLLPTNKKFKVTFAFIGGLNYGNNSTFPAIITNLFGNTYKPALNGFQNSYYLGHLKPIPVSITPTAPFPVHSNYTASIIDNPPIYLDSRPRDNNLQVHILNGTGTTNFQENYLSIIGQGFLQQSGFIVTITQVLFGTIAIGTVLLSTGFPDKTVTAFISGNGGLGTYLVDVSATVSSNLFYSFVADTTRSNMAPYTMNLYFEEVE
jgi:hypothetical protein